MTKIKVTKAQMIRKLLDKGMTSRAIIARTGASPNYVYTIAREYDLGLQALMPEVPLGESTRAAHAEHNAQIRADAEHNAAVLGKFRAQQQAQLQAMGTLSFAEDSTTERARHDYKKAHPTLWKRLTNWLTNKGLS